MTNHVYFAGTHRIGLPKEARVLASYDEVSGFPKLNRLLEDCDPVSIGDGTFVGDNCTVYEGTNIGPKCILEDQTRIGFGCEIGSSTRIMYAAYICDRVTIGKNCRIAGFVCDAARIGKNCTVMGQLSHKYTVSDLEWGDVDEPSPVIEDDCIIGLGAEIIGGIVLGAGTFVAGGSVLTKSTPPNSIVTGTNTIVPFNDWKGADLRAFFERKTSSG